MRTEAEQKIDAAVEKILKAGGNPPLRMYMPQTQAELRKAVREVMSDSYIAGSNACMEALNRGSRE